MGSSRPGLDSPPLYDPVDFHITQNKCRKFLLNALNVNWLFTCSLICYHFLDIHCIAFPVWILIITGVEWRDGNSERVWIHRGSQSANSCFGIYSRFVNALHEVCSRKHFCDQKKCSGNWYHSIKSPHCHSSKPRIHVICHIMVCETCE